jgi:hypothetical protein
MWALALPLLLAPSVLAGLAVAITDYYDAQWALGSAAFILIVGGTFVLTAWGLSALVTWLLGLVAGILASTLIAREREAQTWPFLRLTPLTSADILGGKFVSLYYRLAGPLHLVMVMRVLAVLGGLVTLVLAVVVSRVPFAQAREAVASVFPLVAVEGWLLTAYGVAAAVVGLLSWLFEPYFAALYNGAVGLVVSTLARSRGRAVLLLFAAHLLLNFAVYAPVQQILSLAMFVVFVDTADVNVWFPVLSVTLPFVAYGVLQCAVLAACVLMAYYRVQRLSE